MHGGWRLFSLTLLMEVEESLLKRWVALYALATMWRRGERDKHTCAPTMPCLIHFDRDRHSRLWDIVTLGRSSL
jgi:hypothetical protein